MPREIDEKHPFISLRRKTKTSVSWEVTMQIKHYLRIIFFLGLFSILFHGSAYSQVQLERINAIYASLAGDHAALYVAQEMGLFRKYGLDVNLS